MNPVRLLKNTDTKPLRFAIVFAAIVIFSLMAQKAHSQKIQQVNWTTSYAEAIDEADRTNTPIMLFFSGSDWCPWCKKLDSEVFSTKEFSAWLDSRVVPVMVDFPKTSQLPGQLTNQNNKLLDRYRPHLTGFPTALFIKADGTVIGKLGYEEGGVRKWIHRAQSVVGKLDKIAANTLENLSIR
jgi:protein disulfide-isomerase